MVFLVRSQRDRLSLTPAVSLHSIIENRAAEEEVWLPGVSSSWAIWRKHFTLW